MIYLTEKAAKEVKRISDDEAIGHYIIRVKVLGGGCSGFRTELEFDNQIKDTDQVAELDDVKLICDEVSIQYLDGSSVDYSDGLMGQGFRVNNPNSKGSCGCGQSFAF